NPKELNVIDFQQFQEKRKYSRRPLLFFIIAVFGLPYLMHKFIHAFSAGRSQQQQQQQQQNLLLPSDLVNSSSNIIPNNNNNNNNNPLANLEMCQALYDFKGESQVELTFHRGDIIAILSKVDVWGQPSQWWRGRLRN